MNEDFYFFDTYAFFEIIRGNPKYEEYKSVIAATTIFNLVELNYNLKKEIDGKRANEVTERYKSFLIEVHLEDIKKAMSFKRKYRLFSIPDAVGYTIAKRINAKFLTGDEGFRGFENVELVKKEEEK